MINYYSVNFFGEVRRYLAYMYIFVFNTFKMKHKFIGEPISVGTSLWEITVRLIPANEIETKAIQNMEIDKATDTERSLVNDYLLFSILGWSTLSIHSQNGAIFKLKATNS